jgi:hypothetical protein
MTVLNALLKFELISQSFSLQKPILKKSRQILVTWRIVNSFWLKGQIPVHSHDEKTVLFLPTSAVIIVIYKDCMHGQNLVRALDSTKIVLSHL